KGSDAGRLQGGRVLDQLLPASGRRADAGRGELRGVVPDGVLVGALEPAAVDLAVVAGQCIPGRPVVGGETAQDAGELLDRARLGQRLQGPGVGDEGDIRGSPARNGRLQDGVDV